MSEFMNYIAREKCGCITCACVDNPEHKRDVAKSIASWVRDGLTVERVSSDLIKGSFGRCPKDSTKNYVYKTCKTCEVNK